MPKKRTRKKRQQEAEAGKVRVVMGIDPGKGELNVAVLDFGPKGTRKRPVKATSRVQLPAREVSDFESEETVKEIRAIARDLLDTFSPDVVVIERMMSRPGKAAPLEVINMALGLFIGELVERCKVVLTTAAAWKNWLKRRVDVEQYKVCSNCTKEPRCDHVGTPCMLWREREPWQKLALQDELCYDFPSVHESDAAGIAYWYHRTTS